MSRTSRWYCSRFLEWADGIKSFKGISESLIEFQMTELKDGVFIGYGYNHISFFNTWSDICLTGSDRENFPPLPLRGWFLGGVEFSIRIPVSETVLSPITAVSSLLEDLQDMVFQFTRRNISELKAKANGEVDSDDRKISSLQAILAHLWRSIIRNSDLHPEEVIHCDLLMDMRRRLNPLLEKDDDDDNRRINASKRAGMGCFAMGSQTNEEYKVFAENWANRKCLGILLLSGSL
ncbi:unnamed protein product [Thlaspi arvense]|uniref:Uncharacterized protein n=1 Tax=Thlaspi arvense TaxID=13288 RepID=A0AAU9SIJ3_THLAR|nr:unnamed protein product [Thlaspi arvense]